MWFKKRRDPIETFWNWFLANSKSLHSMIEPDESTIDAVHNQLTKIHPDLVFEVEVQRQPRAFVVSADGDRSLFPLVADVVSRAPAMPEWEVLAFRQPGPTDVAIEMRGIRLGPNDVWFTMQPTHDKVDLTMFVRGMVDENREAMSHGVFILLDNALGEYLVETAVGRIDFVELPPEPLPEDFRPFPELPASVAYAAGSPLN